MDAASHGSTVPERPVPGGGAEPALFAQRLGRGPRVVLVHGFTQTHRSFSELAARLASDHEVVVVDAPGHGRSSGLVCEPFEAAGLLGAAGGRAVYVGYSMGARLCLHLALGAPSLVRALVLVSGTAGIEDPAERARRRAEDEALAASIEAEGVEAFLRRWLARPLFATLPEEAAGLEARLENTAAGLAASLRCLGTGAQASLWGRLGELSMPVLVVAGALDHRYVAIAERLQAGIGSRCELAVVPQAGHALHLERPDAFFEVLADFLRRAAEAAPA